MADAFGLETLTGASFADLRQRLESDHELANKFLFNKMGFDETDPEQVAIGKKALQMYLKGDDYDQ